MTTREAIEIISRFATSDTSFVVSLGRTSEECFNLFPNNALFMDSMGDITSVAIGVALGVGKQHPVIAIDTDGSHLMGITILSTLASIKANLSNLLVIVLDNCLYESVGKIPSRYAPLSWKTLGKAWELEIEEIASRDELIETLTKSFSSLNYIVVQVEDHEPIYSKKNIDGIESKYRFTRHLEKILRKKIINPAIRS